MPRGRPPLKSAAYKRMYTSLDIDTSNMVRAWMDVNGYQTGQESDALMSLIRQALASTPREGALSAERARAYNKVRYFVQERFKQSCIEIKNDVDRMMAEDQGGPREDQG